MIADVGELLRAEGIAVKSVQPGRYYTTCPKCSLSRKGPNQKLECLGVTIDDDAKGAKYGCNHCGFTGGQRLNGGASNSAPAAQRTATYIYRTADGEHYLRVARLESVNGKSYPQSHWDGRQWVKGKPSGSKIPYRLPELSKAPADVPVFVCEGEKCADRVARHGLIATTASEGAGKWTPDLNKWFAGRTVYILPDNDEPGAKHAEQIATNLHGIAADVRIVQLPGLGPGEDVFEWLERGNLHDNLLLLARKAAPLTPLAASQELASAQIVISSGQFVQGFVPPDYLVDGLLQRRFFYSNTAPTGGGKTALSLLLSANVALERPVGERSVEQGRVLYLAGENPDDVRMRWLAMAEHMRFDPADIGVHFIPGVFKISELRARIAQEAAALGGFALVTIDTSAAFFEGDQENDNVQMGTHARKLRELVTLPGAPCVMVNCHPVKNAGNDTLLPRGGGAFVAEVDGNLVCLKDNSLVNLHWQGKFRGPDFAPIPFELRTVTTETLKDSKGRNIPTVIAKHLSENEQRNIETVARTDEDAVLAALSTSDRASLAGIAEALGWAMNDGKPYKMRVQRAMERLSKGKFVKSERGGYSLTPKGDEEAKRLNYNAAAAGAQYG